MRAGLAVAAGLVLTVGDATSPPAVRRDQLQCFDQRLRAGRAVATGGVIVVGMRLPLVQPDVISYNASISACAQGWQWQQASCLLYGDATSRIGF